MKNIKAYINGDFIAKDDHVEIISPLDQNVIGSYPALNKEDIDLAFKSAKNAFKTWKILDDNERIKIIKNFKTVMMERKKEMAELMHLEIGKDVKESIAEIERTGLYIDKTIKAWEQVREKEVVVEGKVSRQKLVPLGVVLAISPFNYPVNLSLAKIVPALLIGNTVVFKAATNGSLVGGMIAEMFDQVNIPIGAFNYVTGRGKNIGDILISHPEIDMISFTGSVRIGKNIAKHTIMKPYVLELGGNDAAYVREDANLENATKEIMNGAYGYAGQRCTAIKRVILHENIANKMIENLIEKVKELPTKPVIDQKTADYIKDLYDDAIANNNKVLVEGSFNKNHISPILLQTNHESRVWHEEPFGPILPIIVAKNDEEAIKLMNDSNFGLQNSFFTEDIEWAEQVAPLIESGTLNINLKSARGPDEFPFLGVKDSGFGVQGIAPALLSMSRILNIVKSQN